VAAAAAAAVAAAAAAAAVVGEAAAWAHRAGSAAGAGRPDSTHLHLA